MISYFGEASTILNLDGTGALDLVTATSREGESGVVMRLSLGHAPKPFGLRPPRGATAPAGLAPVSCVTGEDLAVYTIGHTLLHR